MDGEEGFPFSVEGVLGVIGQSPCFLLGFLFRGFFLVPIDCRVTVVFVSMLFLSAHDGETSEEAWKASRRVSTAEREDGESTSAQPPHYFCSEDGLGPARLLRAQTTQQ